MYELSIAAKYLTPRWRQLSVSIISLISILVIALVVWLIVVFFSVKDGLEKSWIEKLIALAAPVRVTPTEAYYHSYYYQVDNISANSGYTTKTIGEKLFSAVADPYDPEIDEEPPSYWFPPERNADGSLRDLVKETYGIISDVKGVPGIKAQEFLTTVGSLNLNLYRSNSSHALNQASYIGSFETENPSLQKALLEFTPEDAANLLTSEASSFLEGESSLSDFEKKTSAKKLAKVLRHMVITELKTPIQGWRLPKSLLPTHGELQVAVIRKGSKITGIVIPQDAQSIGSLLDRLQSEEHQALRATLSLSEAKSRLLTPNEEPYTLPKSPIILLEGGIPIKVSLRSESLPQARKPRDLRFDSEFQLQGVSVKGEIGYDNLEVAKVELIKKFTEKPSIAPPWIYEIAEGETLLETLPSNEEGEEGILVPKSFRQAGALLGDRGTISYYAPTASSIQEQKVPVYIAGFYDPGIMPLGGKFLLVNSELASLIHTSQAQEGQSNTNGFSVRFNRLEDAETAKAAIADNLKKAGLEKYWNVETYKEFEFTKDFITQLLSEKNMFSLLATVIIIVACSNIISMLIILVNDKKVEIGILRSMGATSFSIAMIFGTCGIVMGLVGSLIGICGAVLTLRNIQVIVDLIGRLQGYEMFNPIFYGETLPAELSIEALGFVVAATATISLLSGLVPAIKASMVSPSEILRSE